jgi:hypothetical protein
LQLNPQLSLPFHPFSSLSIDLKDIDEDFSNNAKSNFQAFIFHDMMNSIVKLYNGNSIAFLSKAVKTTCVEVIMLTGCSFIKAFISLK